MEGKKMKGKVIKASKSAAILAETSNEGESDAVLVNKDEVGYGLIRVKFQNRVSIPEMHDNADDIYFIAGGKGTVYLGGEMVDVEEISQGEYIGKSLKRGTATLVEANDIVSIPRKTPHMLCCPQGEVEFYVVKIY